MESLFVWCAVIGGSIFALQFLLSLLGLGGGHDLDVHPPELDTPGLDVPHLDADVQGLDLHDAGDVSHVSDAVGEDGYSHHADVTSQVDAWFVGIVTFRSVVAAVTVFGLTGLAAMKHLPREKAIGLACLAGAGMLYLVGWSFKQLYKLQSDGTVRMQDAVGCTGTVYLTIPGEHHGAGKVTVKVAGRTMEYRAMTNGEALETGTPIVVSSVISEDTLEVVSQLPTEATASGTHQQS